MGTRERPLQVSHDTVTVLERAVVGLHLRTRCFDLELAGVREAGAGLWILGQFFPLSPPRCHRGAE